VLLQLAADNLARATLNQPAYLQYADFGNQYANLLYQGEYYSDQRLVTEAAAAPLLARLTGTVTVQLLPTPYVAKIDAPETLFKEDLATFEDSAFSHAYELLRQMHLSRILLIRQQSTKTNTSTVKLQFHPGRLPYFHIFRHSIP